MKERVARAATSHMIASRPGVVSEDLVKVGTRVSPVLARSSNSLRFLTCARFSRTIAAIMDDANIDFGPRQREQRGHVLWG